MFAALELSAAAFRDATHAAIAAQIHSDEAKYNAHMKQNQKDRRAELKAQSARRRRLGRSLRTALASRLRHACGAISLNLNVHDPGRALQVLKTDTPLTLRKMT